MTEFDALPDPLAVALDIARHLERLGVEYLVAGSLASSLHGEPRATLDVDLVASLLPSHASSLARDLASDYYIDEETARRAIAEGRSFNAIHFATAIKVDIFVAGTDPFEQERLRCRTRVQVGSEPMAVLYVDTAEHTVVRKLEWFRRGGEVSERQWRDVAAIVRIQGASLDQARMRHWAARLGVADLLARQLE